MKSEEKNIDTINNKENKSSPHEGIFFRVLIVSVLAAAVSGSIFGFLAGQGFDFFNKKNDLKNNSATSAKHQTPEVIQKSLIEEDSAVIETVEKVTPAIVSIIITQDVPKFRSYYGDPFFFDLFDWPMDTRTQTERQKIGGGSGFIVTTDGVIVTNKHVVSSAQADYTVVMSDGREFSARILGRHPSLDIAILKIEGENFSVLELGDSQNIKIGQTVIAIGYSLGEFANSVSKGIISGLQRDIVAGSSFGRTERLTDIIQTDAAINPGNSGGPLLDINGRVIGVNVAMAQGAQNIGFALPINQVKKIIESVEKEGRISVPYIGVRYVIVNKFIQEENNLPFDYGALILRGEKMTDMAVIPGSPADKAGLAENDIILEINGQKIDEKNQLAQMIAKFSVGETLTAKIWRKGGIKEVKITLEERKSL